MAVISSLKTPNSLHIFSMKTSSSSSSSLKTLFQTFIFSQIHRIPRAFTKAKSLLLHLLEEVHFVEFSLKRNKNGEKQKKKLFFGSFRLHYNWCSSHVMPLAQESYPTSHIYYDASWNSVIPTTASFDSKDETTTFSKDEEMQEPEELSRYLEWLEEKKGNIEESSCSNEIDKLADLFIANCHEKFRLEKQESYRRFQEMLARSI